MTIADTHRGSSHKLYVAAAVVFSVILFGGFYRTYFLRAFFAEGPLTALVWTHAIITSLWFATLVAQITFATIGRIDLHRRVGIFGVALAAGVLAVGVPTVLIAAKLGHNHMPGPAIPALAFLLIVFVEFAVLVGSALLLRGRPEFHKRLMLLGTLSILGIAIGRLPWRFIENPLSAIIITDLILLIIVTYDSGYNRRLHPAFLWGGVFLFLAQIGSFAVAFSPAWHRMGTKLVSLIG